MNSTLKNFSSIESTRVCYPDDAEADLVERDVAASLPVIAELTDDLSAGQRSQVYSAAVAKLFADFCNVNGDPFGCDAASHSQLTDEVPCRFLELQPSF